MNGHTVAVRGEGTAPGSAVARVYDRIAPCYDLWEAPMDALGGRARRRRVIGGAHGRVLEVGVGTARNLAFYPTDARITGIDISERMLARARRRAAKLGDAVDLQRADVETLPFEDEAFDSVTATCVFCSVEHPVKGLNELARVVVQHGEVRLLEHVRPRNPVLARIFDWLSPLTRRLLGPELNRDTEDNIRAAGLEIVDIRREGIWREIVARRVRRRAGRLTDASTPDRPARC